MELSVRHCPDNCCFPRWAGGRPHAIAAGRQLRGDAERRGRSAGTTRPTQAEDPAASGVVGWRRQRRRCRRRRAAPLLRSPRKPRQSRGPARCWTVTAEKRFVALPSSRSRQRALQPLLPFTAFSSSKLSSRPGLLITFSEVRSDSHTRASSLSFSYMETLHQRQWFLAPSLWATPPSGEMVKPELATNVAEFRNFSNSTAAKSRSMRGCPAYISLVPKETMVSDIVGTRPWYLAALRKDQAISQPVLKHGFRRAVFVKRLFGDAWKAHALLKANL